MNPSESICFNDVLVNLSPTSKDYFVALSYLFVLYPSNKTLDIQFPRRKYHTKSLNDQCKDIFWKTSPSTLVSSKVEWSAKRKRWRDIFVRFVFSDNDATAIFFKPTLEAGASYLDLRISVSFINLMKYSRRRFIELNAVPKENFWGNEKTNRVMSVPEVWTWSDCQLLHMNVKILIIDKETKVISCVLCGFTIFN